MNEYNKMRSEQLGMNPGTARNKLHKTILFQFVQRTGEDTCYQCDERIDDVDQFSVEHKIPWLHSDDPVALYFDLDNIAYSHLSCNVKASRSGWDLSRSRKFASEEDRKKDIRERNKAYYRRVKSPELAAKHSVNYAKWYERNKEKKRADSLAWYYENK